MLGHLMGAAEIAGSVERATPSVDGTQDLVAHAASTDLAVAALRIGLTLLTIAAASDWVFAVAAGAGPLTSVEGLALTGASAAAAMRPDTAADWLRPPGRAVLLAAMFALAGAADWGVQNYFTEVAPAIVWIAAIVSSSRWVLLCVIVSALGYVVDLGLLGHSLDWMITGAGQDLVVTQFVVLATEGSLVLALVTLVRRFMTQLPSSLAAVRRGEPAITPRLAAAVRMPGQLLLERASAAAVIAPLSPAECKVLDLLAAGRAPKQAARDLVLSVTTVRSHLASAKRKTGARTLEQLVALYSEANLGA
jgi:DNA-binding CsgD family transcriptional regulator